MASLIVFSGERAPGAPESGSAQLRSILGEAIPAVRPRPATERRCVNCRTAAWSCMAPGANLLFAWWRPGKGAPAPCDWGSQCRWPRALLLGPLRAAGVSASLLHPQAIHPFVGVASTPPASPSLEDIVREPSFTCSCCPASDSLVTSRPGRLTGPGLLPPVPPNPVACPPALPLPTWSASPLKAGEGARASLGWSVPVSLTADQALCPARTWTESCCLPGRSQALAVMWGGAAHCPLFCVQVAV